MPLITEGTALGEEQRVCGGLYVLAGNAVILVQGGGGASGRRLGDVGHCSQKMLKAMGREGRCKRLRQGMQWSRTTTTRRC